MFQPFSAPKDGEDAIRKKDIFLLEGWRTMELESFFRIIGLYTVLYQVESYRRDVAKSLKSSCFQLVQDIQAVVGPEILSTCHRNIIIYQVS